MTATLFSGLAPFRPLLKWPGGKGREWDEIGPRLPRRVRDFVDPFLGGGAPFAGTPYQRDAHLNDRHPRLVDLHRRVQQGDEAFLGAVERLGRAWEALALVAEYLGPVFRDLLAETRAERPVDGSVARAEARAACEVAGCGDAAEAIAASVLDKASRLARLERKHGVTFPADAVVVHGETAVRAGLYTFVRERDGCAAGGPPTAETTADFLFVRELCYGAMFRFNADGAFNIPYGGISYNRKSLLARVEQYRAEETRAALARATFSCGDFEPFLDRLRPTLGPDDLVFADPPYDSEFRSYGPDAFTQDDHVRLAAALASLPCPWLLVIQETDFVRATYLGPSTAVRGARQLHAFGKTYGYNVRGRNERAARHLLVGNYDPPLR
jgi:DNA adenine methylase